MSAVYAVGYDVGSACIVVGCLAAGWAPVIARLLRRRASAGFRLQGVLVVLVGVAVIVHTIAYTLDVETAARLALPMLLILGACICALSLVAWPIDTIAED